MIPPSTQITLVWLSGYTLGTVATEMRPDADLPSNDAEILQLLNGKIKVGDRSEDVFPFGTAQALTHLGSYPVKNDGCSWCMKLLADQHDDSSDGVRAPSDDTASPSGLKRLHRDTKSRKANASLANVHPASKERTSFGKGERTSVAAATSGGWGEGGGRADR